jgi:predicted small secreted protein
LLIYRGRTEGNMKGSMANSLGTFRFWSALTLNLSVICILIFGGPAGVWGELPDIPNSNTWRTSGTVHTIVSKGDVTYIGGSFSYVGPDTGAGVSISEATGRLSLPSLRVNYSINAVVPDGSGGWYIGGMFTRVGSVKRNRIAHILSDNSLDTSWNPNANDEVFALAVSGGTVYVGGQFTSIGGQMRNHVAALDAVTGKVTSWNPNADKIVHALAVSGGTVYAGGLFASIGGQSRKRIAALNAVTGKATSWNPNADKRVDALAVSEDTVYAGGWFTRIGGQTRNYVAALDAVTGKATSWNPNANEKVFALAVSEGTVYAGGQFMSIGGQTRHSIAALDAVTGEATSWNPIANNWVYALAVSGGTVYAGGQFTSIGGQTRHGIAALDAATGEATSWNPNPYGWVYALAVSGGTVYAGGSFSSIGGQWRNGIAAIDAVTGEATSWDPNPSFDEYWSPCVYTLAVSGGTVYAGGQFRSIGGQTRHSIAALDAVTGEATSWNPIANNWVYALAVSGETVYAGGSFSSIGGQWRNGIAAIDAVTGEATSWNPNASFGDRSPCVYTLAVNGDTVYAGGSFTSIGGQTRNRIAALDAVTGEATSWNPNSNSIVYALVVDGDTVYAGGGFSSIGGQARKYIAALDAVTGEATSWNPNVKIPESEALALAVSGGMVFAGGTFGSAQFGVYPITAAPDKLEFGTLPIGSTSLSKILTVTNMLESDLMIDSILLTGPDAEDFIVQSDLCSGTTLPPSGNCTVDVSFSPSSTVSKSASVTISSNTPKAWAFDVPLTGTGGIPRVTLFSPNGGEVIPSGPTYDITWWAPSEAVEFKLQYSTDNGATWETIASHLSGMAHGWPVPALQNNKKACLVRVTGYDDSGVKVGSDKSDDPFTIEVASITAPFIYEIVPKAPSPIR